MKKFVKNRKSNFVILFFITLFMSACSQGFGPDLGDYTADDTQAEPVPDPTPAPTPDPVIPPIVPTAAALFFQDSGALDFGSHFTNTTTDIELTIVKTGDLSAELNLLLTESSIAEPFSFKDGTFPGTGGTCTETITSNCTVVVSYSPTAAISSNDTLSILYNNGYEDKTVSRPIVGTGITPATLSISDGVTYDFGNKFLYVTSEKTFTVTKGGDVDAVSVTGSGLTAPYSFKDGSYPGTGGTCGNPINSTCTIVVEYAPTASGITNDTIELGFDDGHQVQTASRPVTGRGLAPAVLQITAASGNNNFGYINLGSLKEMTFDVTKTGDVNATAITPSSLSAPFAYKGGTYPGDGGTCGNPISASCNIVVTYSPVLDTERNQALTIQYHDGQVTQSDEINLQGFGRKNIYAGGYNSCKLINDTDVKCWGDNASGQLGIGSTTDMGDNANEMGVNLPRVDFAAGLNFGDYSYGYNHACAVFSEGQVLCWGEAGNGQLGYGSTNDQGNTANEVVNLADVDLGTGATAKYVRTGRYSSCAILNNDGLKCWGRSRYGELGQGNTSSIGDNANEMGDNLAEIDLGTDRTAKYLAMGTYTTCAILDNNDTKCWGYNLYGQLGQGNTSSIGDNANEMGDNLAAIHLGTGRTAVQLDSDYYHVCAVLDNGDAKCWGNNQYGQLGRGNTSSIGDNANEMGDNLAPINLGTGRTAKYIATGFYHTCAILDNGTVKCWGRNTYGQLGYGDMVQRGDNANEMGDFLPVVDLGAGRIAVSLDLGYYHSCALLDNGDTKCWGRSNAGQLGKGNTSSLGDGANEMGDNLTPIDL